MKPSSILLPNITLIVQPGEEDNAIRLAFAGDPIFKIINAERVDGINYDAFVCPGMFLGTYGFMAPAGSPWPLSLMFSGFKWPRGGGLSSTGGTIPYIGQSDFYFRVQNRSTTPQKFAIRFVGLEMV